ncbi:hypothetical protein [Chitinophaga pinensis]|nr:hypothetical protein [Chitinophaga pinensis]
MSFYSTEAFLHFNDHFMGFFQSIDALNIDGIVTMVFTRNKDNTFTITTAIQHPTLKSEHLTNVIPLNITGPATELDKDYFTAFGEWMVRLDNSLVSNVKEVEASYKKAQEKLKQKTGKPASKEEKPGYELPEKLRLAPNSEYLAAKQKVELLLLQKKYGQAKSAMPSKERFPEHAEEIDAMIAEIYKNRSDLLL